jgi:hypothetical protein
MHKGHIAHGRITGTGAVINVSLGFIPETVVLRNITSGDELFWDEGMAAANGRKRVAAGTSTLITSGGITAFAGVAGTSAPGFTIGTDTDMNVSAEILHYTAILPDA